MKCKNTITQLTLATATVFAVGCGSTKSHQTAQNYPTRTYQAQNVSSERYADFVGAQGPDGPTGARGVQGPIGQTGPQGYAMAGSRGPTGATGAMGERGQMGAQGPSGNLAVGPTGVVGPAGSAGSQGTIGMTGVQGASADGFAGPAGPVGRTGAQGPTGPTGAKGPTLIGPAGPAGRSGPTGQQGERGLTGAQGLTMAGIAGETGASGDTGPQGPIGPIGPQGPAGVLKNWVFYREFWFDVDSANVHRADADKVKDIAAYLKDNPSLHLGIDANGNRALATRRGNAIRDALIAAGTPDTCIKIGAFGDRRLRRDHRVEILLKTDDQLARAE